MSSPLWDVPRPRTRVIDTLAAEKRFYARLILHRSFFLQSPLAASRHYLHIVNDVLYYRKYCGNTGSLKSDRRRWRFLESAILCNGCYLCYEPFRIRH